ncbi:MAG: RNA 2',3'-cyclic phosphodiesterase [Ignavibacteriaceae bacterium]|nr:RNA 2',3'-cyclic phosphodiesterase [Ignavibacteriaceae bacterium]
MNRRLFIALDLPAEAKKFLTGVIGDFSSGLGLRPKWEREEKLHLTLKFLGDTAEELLPLIKSKFYALYYFKPFHIKISKFGIFSRGNTPQILWAGLEIKEDIIPLLQKIEKDFSAIGFKRETRPFSPHITVLRIKPYYDHSLISKIVERVPGDNEFMINKLVLYESSLLKSGSVYNKVNEIELQQ